MKIPVRTTRKPTRLSAHVGTTINVRQELVEVSTLLQFTIEHAGIDTFRFAVPAAVADKIQIEAVQEKGKPGIKQQSRSEETEEGWVAMTVVMQQEVTGRQQFKIHWDLKPDRDNDENDTPSTAGVELAVQPLRVLGLEGEADESTAITLSRIVGEVAVVKDRALSVSAEATGGDVEAIDVRELKRLDKAGYLAYRYHKQPVDVQLRWTKHEIQEVLQTVVSKALVEIVVSREAVATYRCRYRIKSSERQRLRIDLPKGFDPLGAFVDRNLVNLEKNAAATPDDGWDAFFVNVARTKHSDQPFLLTIQFRWKMIPAPFERAGGTLYLPLPRIGGSEQSGVAVQQLRTAVWVPEKYALVGAPQSFTRETSSRLQGRFGGTVVGEQQTGQLDGWIGGETGGLFDFPTEGHHAYQFSSLGGAPAIEVTWLEMPFYSWILSGAIFLIALTLRKTSWENKLGVLLMGGFVAALIALWDYDWVYHALAAARFGIVAMLAYWLIQALFAARHSLGPLPAASVASIRASGGAVVIPPPGVFESIIQEINRKNTNQ